MISLSTIIKVFTFPVFIWQPEQVEILQNQKQEEIPLKNKFLLQMSSSKLRIWKREELLQDNDPSKTLKCSNYSYKHKLKSLELLEVCRDLKNGVRLRLCRPRRSLNTNRGWNFCIPLHFKWILHFWSAGKTAIAQTDINTICSQKELICKGYGGFSDLGLRFHLVNGDIYSDYSLTCM